MKRLVAFSRKGRRHIPIVALGLLLGVTIAGSEPAHGLARLGDVASRATFGNQLTVQRPTSTTSGDLLVASVDARLSGTDSIVPPSGWSLIRQDSNAPPYVPLSQALYFKVAGSSEPANYSWTLASSVSVAGSIVDVHGIDVSMPIDSHSGAFTPNARSFVAPSITTTAAGDVVLGFFGMTSNKMIRPPGVMTELFDAPWTPRQWALDGEGAAYVQANAGRTGDMTASTSGARPSSSVGQLLALRAAASSTTPPPTKDHPPPSI